ncbi:MAG: phosphatase PAP2 family protein [Nocardioidaceae bacterium]
MWKQRLGFAMTLSIGLAIAACLVAAAYDLPLRDPDGVVAPTWVRLPGILGLAYLTDVAPRAFRRAGGFRGFWRQFKAVTIERWHLAHVRFALVGLGSWYLTYVAFRNLKNFVPFVHPDLMDDTLHRIDRTLMFGHDPAVVLHQVLGTGISAHILSLVYIAWIVIVPVSLAGAMVWSRDVAASSWYVTALVVDWVLGVAAYFVVPTWGPIYARPEMFTGLPYTLVTKLQDVMWHDHQEVVLHGAGSTHALQSIAAFPSLHVGIMVTIAVVVHLLNLPRWVRWTSWIFLALTVLATVYLGWHYLTDGVGGAVLGVAGVWFGALATGNHVNGRLVRRGRGTEAPEQAAVSA